MSIELRTYKVRCAFPGGKRGTFLSRAYSAEHAAASVAETYAAQGVRVLRAESRDQSEIFVCSNA